MNAAGQVVDGPVSWLGYAFRFMQLPLGLFGVALGLFVMVAVLAFKLLLVGSAVYVVILVVSPSTARELREKKFMKIISLAPEVL